MLFPNTSLYTVYKKIFLLSSIPWESLSGSLGGFESPDKTSLLT